MVQQNYLKILQIESWKLQRNPSVSFYLLQERIALFGAENATSPEEELLVQIVKACQLPYVVQHLHELQLSALPSTVTVLIFLGDSWIKRFSLQKITPHQLHMHQHLTILVTHALSAMLQDKQLKRQVWSDLQTAIVVKHGHAQHS